MRSVCVARGDGIGPEVIDCAILTLEAVTSELEFVDVLIGERAFRESGKRLPDDTMQAMKDTDSCLFGAVTSKDDPGYDSPVLSFRQELDLYANVRPVKDIACASGFSESIDFVIVRENTEGLYTRDETADDGGVTTRRRVTRRASERIVAYAVDLALRTDRHAVCCVHKANVLRQSDGLFLEVFRATMGERGPGLEATDQLVDSAAAKLVTAPHAFDVVVTLNLYGDILSDVAAAIIGGLGFAPSANLGPEHSVFEPAHGSAPDIAGKGIANPTAAMLSGCMMLEHMGMSSEAARIEKAIMDAYRSGFRTVDVGGTQGSTAFTQSVLKRL